MATPDELKRQVELETKQVEEGIAQLHSDIQKAEDKQYASSTFYGRKLVREALPVVAKEIDRVRTTRLLRGTGVGLAAFAKRTRTLDPEALALIVLKTLFDVTTHPKDKSDLVTNVIDRVGLSVEQEAKWRWFEEKLSLIHI